MGSDLLTLNALAKELNTKIQGAKIEKIVQPEKDEIRFFIRVNNRNECLVISCNSQTPRCHLTYVKKENPINAPAFCMLLRKYLIGGTIESASIFNADRIIKLKITARNEMKDICTYYLFIEIMSRYSNIIFTDADFIIFDAIKRIPLNEDNTNHLVMHGAKYEPLEQGKESFLTSSFDFMKDFKGGDLHSFILDNITGFSGITVSEIIARCGFMNDGMPALNEEELNRFKEFINKLKNITEQDFYSPCVIDNKGVYPFAYMVLNKDVVTFPTINEAFDDLLSKEDGDLRLKAKIKNLVTATRRFKARVEKRIIDDAQKLQATEDMNIQRYYGDMIINNIYLVKKGDSTLKCTDYTTGETVTIPLDPTLTPSNNAKVYYSKYNKLKRTRDFLSKKIEDDRAILDYVKSIEQELSEVTSTTNPSSIEQELINIGALYAPKTDGKKKVRNPKPDPIACYDVEGFQVYVGNNNIQNDELTFKIASPNDIWMHLKNEHGRHTIIITNGKEVPDSVLKIASEITASTKTGKIAVDYTIRKNVKRINGTLPGLVTYVNYNTLYVTPNSHEELRLNGKSSQKN